MQSKTILVTGANGFVGKHLCKELYSAGHIVIASGIDSSPDEEIAEYVNEYIGCDLADKASLDIIPFSKIDVAIHLAGLSAVGPSFDNPSRYMSLNTSLLINVFEGFLKVNIHSARVISVSSGAVYESSGNILDENSKVSVSSPYVASKLGCEVLVDYYRNRGFVDSVSIRPFNHVGPGQAEGFLVPDVARQLAEAPRDGKIMVGNIKTSRDYTDVRDVCRAYRMLAEARQLNHSLYNICSGASHTGVEIIELLQKQMSREDVTIEIDQSRVRPNDVMHVQGSYVRIQNDIGWRPAISLEDTLRDVAVSY